MKHIIKSQSEEFEAWKNNWKLTKEDLLNNSALNEQKNLIWEKLSGEIKNTVKQSLLEEQGFICCYCQQRIEFDKNTIIEHFIARNIAPAQMFEYENIFACCDGGDKEREVQKQEKTQKSKRTPQYCDRKKEDSVLLINPLNENCESHFYYSFNFNFDNPEVHIEELSPEGKDTIQKLNLDIEKLRKLRGESIVNLVLDENGDYISIEETEQLLEIIRQKKNNKFLPFCVALEQILQSLQLEQNYVA